MRKRRWWPITRTVEETLMVEADTEQEALERARAATHAAWHRQVVEAEWAMPPRLRKTS